jgi:hypothetical protein
MDERDLVGNYRKIITCDLRYGLPLQVDHPQPLLSQPAPRILPLYVQNEPLLFLPVVEDLLGSVPEFLQLRLQHRRDDVQRIPVRAFTFPLPVPSAYRLKFPILPGEVILVRNCPVIDLSESSYPDVNFHKLTGYAFPQKENRILKNPRQSQSLMDQFACKGNYRTRVSYPGSGAGHISEPVSQLIVTATPLIAMIQVIDDPLKEEATGMAVVLLDLLVYLIDKLPSMVIGHPKRRILYRDDAGEGS